MKNFSDGSLRAQLNATLGDGFVATVKANHVGIYHWTTILGLNVDGVGDERAAYIYFGPTAWFSNNQRNPWWTRTVPPSEAEYSRLFIGRGATRELRQSSVTLREVLDGLAPDDRRLHDEFVSMFNDDAC